MIIIKSNNEKIKMKESGRIVALVLDSMGKIIEPNIKTIELDRYAEDLIIKEGGIPAFKGYKGFPSTLCVSINEEIVHGIPSEKRLKDGDIVSIDVGVKKNGYFGDSARTYLVGNVDNKGKRLVQTTVEALFKGIEKAVPGNRISDMSNAIQFHIENAGYSVVRQFVGHGVGKNLHEDPQIPNYGPPGRGAKIKEGMAFALEPMVCEGKHWEAEIKEDGWTAICKDYSRAAHFEHTLFINAEKAEILTDGGYHEQ